MRIAVRRCWHHLLDGDFDCVPSAAVLYMVLKISLVYERGQLLVVSAKALSQVLRLLAILIVETIAGLLGD